VSATGTTFAMSPSTGCCGALAEHGGLTRLAHQQAARTMASMPGDAPILVDSAGCGAMLKDYGRVLDTDEARRFSVRVVDVHEWLVPHLDVLPGTVPGWSPPRVAVQDPCHLRHVQRAHLPVRTVLSRVATLAELDDDGRCCGAGGAFSVTQPQLADAIRSTKVEAIERVAPDVVVSANPGCAIHLSWAGIPTRHPMSIVAAATGVGGDHGR
jgi:glycolate oxidase iron-sulfur subunit